MRMRFVLAAVVALVALSGAPASAATGWTFHSGGYNDDILVNTPCLDKAQQLVAAGTVADAQCRLNSATGYWDLYTVSGTWTHHSAHYNSDGFGFACIDAGNALVTAGSITTFQCRFDSTAYIKLWVII